PTKKTGNVRHFQRAQIPMHVQEVSRFFDNKDNSSPTAIVVGFDPIRARHRIKVLDAAKREVDDNTVVAGEAIYGALEVTWNSDTDPQTRDEKITAVTSAYSVIQEYVFNELIDITGGKMSPESLDRLARTFREKALSGELPDTVSDEDGDTSSDDD